MPRIIRNFPPLASTQSEILILGSIPGRRSLEMNEYYAHPRNAFWKIMEDLYGISFSLPYEERAALLVGRGLALWDVVERCERAGSLDADIRGATASDFASFYKVHSFLRRVCFNGSKAESIYRSKVLPVLGGGAPAVSYIRLPSTSAAFAAMGFSEKAALWKRGLTGA